VTELDNKPSAPPKKNDGQSSTLPAYEPPKGCGRESSHKCVPGSRRRGLMVGQGDGVGFIEPPTLHPSTRGHVVPPDC
jgi:hypothetical protein